MVTIIGGALIISGLIAAIRQVNNKLHKQIIPFYLILVLAVILLGAKYFTKVDDSESSVYTIYLSIVLALGCLLAFISRKSASLLWALILPLTTAGVFFIQTDIEFLQYPLTDTLYIFIIALLASIAPLLIYLSKIGISKLITRFVKTELNENEKNHLYTVISFIYVAIIALIAGNLLSNFGLLIVMTFHAASTFVIHGKEGVKSEIAFSTVGSIALITVLPTIIEYTGFTSLDILQPKLLLGIFIGGFILLFYHLILNLARRKEGKWKTILIIKIIVVCLGAFSLLGIGYTTKESVGGSDAMLVGLIAIAFGSFLVTLLYKELSVAIKLLALGATILLIPYSGPSAESQEESILPILQTNQGSDSKTIERSIVNVNLGELDGEYTMVQDSSTINFELGPKNSRTKGRIKKPNGKLILKKDINKSMLEVTLQVNQLSTYNSIRDEHLMEDEYFGEAKFPEMKFKSSKISQAGGVYKAIGSFEMLKKTVDLEISFKAIEYGEKIILKGNAELDRTKFGMSPDPKIGNVVEFNFSALFEK